MSALKKKTKKEHSLVPTKESADSAGEIKKGIDPTEITVVEDQPLVPQDYKTKLSRGQVEIIKNTIAKGASDDELKMFLYVCERTRLDPFTKQIHLVPRWDAKLGKEVRMPIVGIDGLRAVAERSGDYAGNDDPAFDDEAKPTRATVTVRKMVQGQIVDFKATARWDQYVPKKKDGTIASPLWVKMPHLLLGKCAEALALRKAFPTLMSGLYVAEELQQAQVSTTGTTGSQESDFEKASRIIGKMTNVDGLEELKQKLQASNKYPAHEKAELGKIIDEQISKLVPPIDAPRNVPPAQHAENAGDESQEL